MRFFNNRPLLVLAIVAVSTVITSCQPEDDDQPTYTVPTTYTFSNVSYAGQTDRMNMLSELDAYVKTGNNGAVLSIDKMKDLYANTNAPFSSAQLNNSGKQLKDKTILAGQLLMETWFLNAVNASLSAGAAATNGTAGLLTTVESIKYLVDANGVEPAQVIQKSLMGAILYYQAVDGYLTPAKTGPAVDNATVKEGEGTLMEHHFDEAFGYFGAPANLPTNTQNLKYWANYSNKVNMVLGTNKTMMDAFLKGRAAITAKDMQGKDAAIAVIRSEWEKLVAASVILELNLAKANMGDQAKKSHYLSEGLGFVYSLGYKADSKLTSVQQRDVITKLGTNFYTTTIADIEAATNIISAAYGLETVKARL